MALPHYLVSSVLGRPFPVDSVPVVVVLEHDVPERIAPGIDMPETVSKENVMPESRMLEYEAPETLVSKCSVPEVDPLVRVLLEIMLVSADIVGRYVLIRYQLA
jgi:hypothetical protein